MLTLATSHIVQVLATELDDIQTRMRQTQSELVGLRSSSGAVDEARCQSLENQTTILLNQYVSIQRLHAANDLAQALTGIYEVLETLVGVEKFVMYMGATADRRMYSIIQYPVDHFDDTIEVGMGQIGKVLSETEPFFESVGRIAVADGSFPIAVIPLRHEGTLVGTIAVFKLFEQKGGFNQVDTEIFKLFSRFAGTVVVGAIAQVKRKYELSTMQEISEYARRVQASDF
ncbi:MAG: GAF domain-containing protein [Myxococcota bacterium]|jgi:hypothetical protein|nr:GAF domain-containing protein [Myxococcota bacterium]